MALTQLKTGAIADDAVTTDKLANAINTERTANTAKDLTALSASNLTSGTVPDARFPATLPAASAANLTSVPAGNLTGTVADARISALTASKLTGALPAISAASCTNIPAANITGTLPAISGANLTNLPASGKATNLIINGACLIAQRGTSSSSSGYQTVDRFKHSGSGWDSAITQKQIDVGSGTTPYTEGFRKAFQLTNGNQSSGGQAGDSLSISYVIEDQDLATSGWNYLSATSYVTLSFWFKSSINQTFYVVLESKDGTSRQYSFAITPTGADTWTKVTKTIPGNSGLQFSNDNGEGIEIYFLLFYGTDLTTSSHTLNTWSTTSSSDQAPDMTATWFETDNALFDLTGLQLEVGDSATDFAHKSYADELRHCERYYVHYLNGGIRNAINSNSDRIPVPQFRTPMRATPTVTASSFTEFSSGSSRSVSSFSGVGLNGGGYAQLTSSPSNGVYFYIHVDAEL